ncbi:hypothetical protein SAY86_025548 [Trapa natans]|uniref:glucan endo-1,3-beta-D-glucosidase n=1 Tax=Trapa natans TaxID=22666 RepID=A0AAN7MXJ6_TRANT|nr:hypothetical protein SAY86_025548 [Trapa natans]
MAKSLLPSALLFLVLSLLAVINLTEAQIGVCYGMLGDNLPSRQEVVNMYEQYGIRRMRLYGPDGAAFQALDGSQIELILDVPYQNLPDLAQNLSSATAWVHDNIINHPGVNFK